MYTQFLISQGFESRSNVNPVKVQKFHDVQKMCEQSRDVKKHTKIQIELISSFI